MLKPKKSLGQNFLRDEKVLEKIIIAADLKADDAVLEIGPGEGVLTKELVKKAGKVIAIEKDDALAKKLKAAYKNNTKIEIINADILNINLPEILCHSERSGAKSKNLPKNTTGDTTKKILAPPLKLQAARGRLRPSTDSAQDDAINYKVVANIPYYITSPIIRLFLETKYPPKDLILMVQKEVAERICAEAGQMSILAVSVQYYAVAKTIMSVDKKSFWPVPEVDSAVIRIVPRRKNIPQEESRLFFRLVKAGFSAKRKTLINNLSTSLQLDKKIVAEKIAQTGLAPAVRAQELSLANWKKLKDLLLPELL